MLDFEEYVVAVEQRKKKLEAVQDYLNDEGRAVLRLCGTILWLAEFADTASELVLLLEAEPDDDPDAPPYMCDDVVTRALYRVADRENETED